MKKKLKELLTFIKNFYRNYPICCFYVVSNLINGMMLRLFSTGNLSFRAFLFDFFFVFMLGSFAFFIKKNKRRNIYYIITSIVMTAICIINGCYYNYYSSFVSISLISTSVFVQDFGDVIFEYVISVRDVLYLWQIIGIILVCIKKKDEEYGGKKSFFKGLVISMFALGIGCSLPPYNSWSRLFKIWNRVAVVNNFGVYVYQVDDLIQSLKPAFNNVFGYDNALKEVKEYFSEKEEPVDNEYTGIFEGKNVIVIHAESLQALAIGLEFNGEEVTPNLNKLIKESMYFSNFYAQIGVGTSSDSEFTYASSLLPANNGTVFVNYYNNMYITIQKLLKEKGYYVFSMHGNVGDFWNRNTMHINMGYDKFYSKSSFVIDEEVGLGLSDHSFFKQAVPMIKDIKEGTDGPFYGTLITLSNHTPWEDADSLSDLNVTKTVTINGKEVTRDYLEGTTLGRYFKSINYMDKCIGEFLEDLESNGLLENTVIVIYGDHDARIAKSNYDYMYNYDAVSDTVLEEGDEGYIEFNDYDYELNRQVPLIIWSSDLGSNSGKVIDTPMGMIDVLPTLGNMLNIYNEYALGTDIMSITNGENTVVFKDGSYVTDKIYYSARNNEAYVISNEIITKDYISDNADYANTILDISDKIISYDLLKALAN